MIVFFLFGFLSMATLTSTCRGEIRGEGLAGGMGLCTVHGFAMGNTMVQKCL